MTIRCTAAFGNPQLAKEFVEELEELGAKPIITAKEVYVEYTSNSTWHNATILGMFASQYKHNIEVERG